ncbi:hypothetical protein DAPPUDRAFT_235864 [Daphnia pulex]|uniref:Uncharacterized protein n=1 Tax=Daphnia pulex TaxID=6669 RepID=E9FZ90_DAPPU|nr:hypothetical protein DAPPUDRAFT_235864 [Daphnia pulex]|eukprot:EFX87013.1 hypothetical protein DAPPUDRAFT_235864 [Daphnia pulex]
MLRKLEIGGSSFCQTGETAIAFDGGVAPLLKAFGRSLETLIGASVSFKNEDLFQLEKKPPILKELQT